MTVQTAQNIQLVGVEQEVPSVRIINLAGFPHPTQNGAIALHQEYESEWVWDLERIELRKLSSAKVEESIELHEELRAGNEQLAQAMFKYRRELLTEWEGFELYFLGTTHVSAPWIKYVRVLHREAGDWKLSFRRTNQSPRTSSRIQPRVVLLR